MSTKPLWIRCRAVIIHDGKLFTVVHRLKNGEQSEHAALPGGGMNSGEGIHTCIEREILEELGVRPKVGRLLFIHNFLGEKHQNIEFFFEVTNGADFLGCTVANDECSHGFEIAEIKWISPADTDISLLPQEFHEAFRNEAVFNSAEPRFIGIV